MEIRDLQRLGRGVSGPGDADGAWGFCTDFLGVVWGTSGKVGGSLVGEGPAPLESLMNLDLIKSQTSRALRVYFVLV